MYYVRYTIGIVKIHFLLSLLINKITPFFTIKRTFVGREIIWTHKSPCCGW